MSTGRKAPATSNSISRDEYLAQLDYEWSEKQFQTKVNRDFKQAGWLNYHTLRSKGSEGGFPDNVILGEESGRQLVIELKVKKRKPTDEQKRWLRAFRRAGSEVYVLYPRHFYLIGELTAGGYDPQWEWEDPDG